MLNGTGTRSAIVYIVTSSPSTETSGRRKWRSAARIAMHDASTKPPSASNTWTSALTDQHLAPEMMHSDSVSIALDRRMAFSRMRDRSNSCSVCLRRTVSIVLLGLEWELLPPNLKRRRSEWTQFSHNSEDPIKFSILQRPCDLCGHLNKHSDFG